MLVSQGDADTLHALLQIIADPAKAKEHLDALAEAKKQADDAAAKAASDKAETLAHSKEAVLLAKAHADDAEASLKAADLTLTVHRKEVAQFEAAAAARKKVLDDKEASLLAREQALLRAEQDHEDWSKKVYVREADIRDREDAAAKSQKAADGDAAVASKLRAEYEDKLAKLKALAG